MALPDVLHAALAEAGFTTPTPVQAGAIPPALEGRDILATAQTGTGKTAAFVIPLLSKMYTDPGKQALVLAPTRELAAQIHKVFRALGKGMKLHGALVVGGESMNRQISILREDVDYIVATPGRLNDHLERRSVNLSKVAYLVLDEMDRMLDMGFKPQVEAITTHLKTLEQRLLFSATLPREIAQMATELLKSPARVAIADDPALKPKIKEETLQTTALEKNDVLLKEINAREGRILVFARTRSRTERLARTLTRAGLPVVCLHGSRTHHQRKHALEQFKGGTHRIMVATDVAGRGIDILDLEHVINYDCPGTREDYLHRIGRTGRAGKEGRALSLLTPEDRDASRIVHGKRDEKSQTGKAPFKPRAKVFGDKFGPRSPRKFEKRFGKHHGGGMRPKGPRFEKTHEQSFSPKAAPVPPKFDPSFRPERKGGFQPKQEWVDRTQREVEAKEGGHRPFKPFKNERAEEPSRPFEERPAKFHRKPDGEGRRPWRGDRSFGPREERDFGPRKFGERKFGDRKFGGPRKPGFGGKQFGDRKFGDRPFGDRKFGDRKFGERPFGDRKFGDRKFGDRKFGERRFDDRKFGARKFEGPRPAHFGPRKFDAEAFASPKAPRPGGKKRFIRPGQPSEVRSVE